MKIAFFLGHPAHYHMLKFVAQNLENKGHSVEFVIKEKDILQQLLIKGGHTYTIIRGKERKSSSILGLIFSLLKMDIKMLRYLFATKPDVLVGTYVALLSKCSGKPIIVLNEDDASVVPYFALTSYPLANTILNPQSCNSGYWDKKAIKYAGFQKLAYLHPHVFMPNSKIVNQYFPSDQPYFLLRFAKLDAHHDSGVKGFTTEIALKIIDMLKPYGDIYISSERPLDSRLNQYCININPLDIHHVLAFAQFYLGDSQSMAVEAAMLGVPFIRYNDFIGKIGVLNEIEEYYKLGFGINSQNIDELYNTIEKLLAMPNRKDIFQQRRKNMLSDKINVTLFLTWFIENYPQSKKIMKKNSDYQYQFK